MVTRADLIDELARLWGFSQTEATGILETMFERMAVALSQGDKVEIRGLGGFRVRVRRARIARNPKSGVKLDVPVKRAVIFRAGREIRAVLAGRQSSVAARTSTASRFAVGEPPS